MKALEVLTSVKGRLSGIVLLSGIALSSSLHLQYVELYPPCVYCYVLRYLTLAILVMAVAGLVNAKFGRGIASLLSGVSMVSVGISIFLIFDELFPARGICNACAFSPSILGISLYYYALVFTLLVLALSLSIVLRDEADSQLAG